MLQALANYIRTETDKAMINRFEALFSNALDPVESLLTTIMPTQDLRLEIIGAAIQMWVEYRVTIGKRPLDLSHPEAWAATWITPSVKSILKNPHRKTNRLVSHQRWLFAVTMRPDQKPGHNACGLPLLPWQR